MHDAWHRRFEWLAALLCVAAGLAAAAAFAPATSFFLGNFFLYWLPQGGVLVLLSMYKPPRPAAYAGVAGALAAYFLLFHSWVFSRQHPESMAWLGYLFSIPGAVVGAFVALALLARRQITQAVPIGIACALGVASGLAVNQAIVCSTVMHCTGK
jgi:uncharacterized membrane protein YoaK (UPF0700 family)